MNSASLCSLAGRYENPIPPQCLAPIDFLKIPAQAKHPCGIGSLESIPGLLKSLKFFGSEPVFEDLLRRPGIAILGLAGRYETLFVVLARQAT
jgi:hypothetical protein